MSRYTNRLSLFLCSVLLVIFISKVNAFEGEKEYMTKLKQSSLAEQIKLTTLNAEIMSISCQLSYPVLAIHTAIDMLPIVSVYTFTHGTCSPDHYSEESIENKEECEHPGTVALGGGLSLVADLGIGLKQAITYVMDSADGKDVESITMTKLSDAFPITNESLTSVRNAAKSLYGENSICGKAFLKTYLGLGEIYKRVSGEKRQVAYLHKSASADDQERDETIQIKFYEHSFPAQAEREQGSKASKK